MDVALAVMLAVSVAAGGVRVAGLVTAIRDYRAAQGPGDPLLHQATGKVPRRTVISARTALRHAATSVFLCVVIGAASLAALVDGTRMALLVAALLLILVTETLDMAFDYSDRRAIRSAPLLPPL